jgi:hypothetical protein
MRSMEILMQYRNRYLVSFPVSFLALLAAVEEHAAA